MTDTQQPTSAAQGTQTPVPLATPLPEVVSTRAPAQIVAELSALARRGSLPGFEEGRAGVLFTAAAVGSPFDGVLEARAEADGAGTRLRFRTRLTPLMPLVYATVLAGTVWPGVALTESLIASLFSGSSAWRYTWWWYLPLTLPFAPWAMHVALRRSRAAVHDSAHRTVAKLASVLAAATRR